MKSDPEIYLMKVEARLDRIQNEARKALGEARSALEYYKPNRQKTLVQHTIGHRAGKCKGVKRFRREENESQADIHSGNIR